MSRNSYYPSISQIYNFQVGHRKEEKTKSDFIPPISYESVQQHNSEFLKNKIMKKQENFDVDSKNVPQQSQNEKKNKLILPSLNETSILTKPEVFGPYNWFVFHNTATNYPQVASPLFAERMKNFILAIPLTLPCQKCKEDATAYIDSYKNQLDLVVSGREQLFNFFVDFHNFVNLKLGKRSYTYDEVKILYNYNK
jgi:hypothetical protein